MLRTPTPLNDYSLLVAQLKSGNADAVEQIILGHVQLAQRLAINWSKRVKASWDVMEAEALYLLTVAVSKAKESLIDNNISEYINVYINRGLLNFCYKTRLINASHEKLGGLRIKRSPLLIQFSEGWLDPEFEDDLLVDSREKGNRHVTEMMQILEDCIITSEEKELVRLRLIGHSNDEVSELMNLSYHQVGRIRRGIEQRFFKEFLCESQSMSALPASNSTQAVEMTTTSDILLRQQLLVTHKPSP